MDPDQTSHKNHIGPKYLDSELFHPTNQCGDDGQTQIYKGGRSLPVPQGFPISISHHHKLHSQRVVDTTHYRIGIIYDNPWGRWAGGVN